MKLISVNVGLPQTMDTANGPVLTSIVKAPVAGRVAIHGDNVDGDRQADLSVHGGQSKAVYAYPAEHYAFWREQLPAIGLTWGYFGENLTIEGLLEDDVHVGDRLRVGSAELVVTQPRMPCFKLGLRFNRPDIVKRFLDSRRSGFYLSVAAPGEVSAGDRIAVVERHAAAISIRELLRMHLREQDDADRLQAAIDNPALSEAWRREFVERRRRAGADAARAQAAS